MKNFINKIIILFFFWNFLLVQSSCVNHRSVTRWIKLHPEKLELLTKREFKTRVDTIRVPVKGDTIVKKISGNDIDSTFKQGRAEVRLVVERDTIRETNRIYLRAVCKPDTIVIFDRDTIAVNTTNTIGVVDYKPWWRVILSNINWLLVAIIGLFTAYYYKQSKTSL